MTWTVSDSGIYPVPRNEHTVSLCMCLSTGECFRNLGPQLFLHVCVWFWSWVVAVLGVSRRVLLEKLPRAHRGRSRAGRCLHAQGRWGWELVGDKADEGESWWGTWSVVFPEIHSWSLLAWCLGTWARQHLSHWAGSEPKPHQWDLLGDVCTGRLWPPVMSPGVHPGPLCGQNVGLGVGWRRGSSQGQIRVSFPQVLEARQNHTQESAASTCCPVTG